MKERYKHLVNFMANMVTLLFEAVCFGYLWYVIYVPQMEEAARLYRRGNWAVIGIYVLFVFLLTNSLGGYKIAYMRVRDIALSHVLAIIISGVIAYFEVCLIANDYMNPVYTAWMMLIEIVFIVPWILFIRKLYERLYPPRQLLVIYGDYPPDDLIGKINSRKERYNICETVSYKMGLGELNKIMDNYSSVVLCDLPAEIRNDLQKYCYIHSIRTYVTPKITDILFRGADDIHLFDTPLLISRNQGLSIVQLFVKRIMDIVISLIGCVIASPFMLIIAICIKLYDRGPVFYKQERLTRNGEKFMIYKFRSMSMDSEVSGARLAAKNDKRVTPVGRVIRNIHFDELPQLFNILKGDMSVVGPRPEREVIAKEYEESIPEFTMRLKVKAGLTGYAQVYGKYNTTPYDKLKMDITYIENYSFWMDIRILLLTVKILFQKENTEGVEAEQKTALKK